MSNLIEKIKADILVARKAKEKGKVTLLSTVLGEIVNQTNSPNTNPKNLPIEEMAIQVINKFIKNNKETIKILRDKCKTSLVVVPETENLILSDYLPKQMSEWELKATIQDIITEQELTSPKQMGLIMKTLKEHHNGLYDGKLASQLAKQELIK